MASLPPGRVLNIGCGTGYLTRLLRGSVDAVDQSAEMLELARACSTAVELVQGDVPPLPFADGAFDLAFSSNVYSHIETAAVRAEFVADALRVSRELVVLEQAWRLGRARESWEPGGWSMVRGTASLSATSRPTSSHASWTAWSCSRPPTSSPCELPRKGSARAERFENRVLRRSPGSARPIDERFTRRRQ